MKPSDLLILVPAALLAVPLHSGPPRQREAPGPAQPPAAAAQVGEDRFDGRDLSSYTTSSPGGGHWNIERGALVGTGPAIQSVLVRKGLEMADGWVEAESARADDGGLVLRYRNWDDYYLLVFRDDEAPRRRAEANLAMYHRVDGQYLELWRADLRWPRGTTHTVRFEARGPRLRAYFDGALVGEAALLMLVTDPRPYVGSGRVGVRNSGRDRSWTTSFDTFRWHEIAPPTGEPAL